MLICERCGKDCGAPPTGGHGRGLWTYRDPAIPIGERYHGHGILSVCAECLADLGGQDYRGMTLGQVLDSLERRRRLEGRA